MRLLLCAATLAASLLWPVGSAMADSRHHRHHGHRHHRHHHGHHHHGHFGLSYYAPWHGYYYSPYRYYTYYPRYYSYPRYYYYDGYGYSPGVSVYLDLD